MLDASWRGPLGPRSEERRRGDSLSIRALSNLQLTYSGSLPKSRSRVFQSLAALTHGWVMCSRVCAGRAVRLAPPGKCSGVPAVFCLRIGRRRSLVQYCARQMCDAERTHLVLGAFPGSVAAMTRTMSLEKPFCSEIHYCSIYVRSANAHATRNPCEFIVF